MKILLVSLNHAPEQTGIGKFQGEMAAWLAAHGHDVRVIAAPPYYPEWKVASGYCGYGYRKEVMDGATVYRVPIYVPAQQSGAKRMLHLASFAFSSLPVILGQALLWRPDVIWLTEPPLFVAPSVLLGGILGRSHTHFHVQDFEVDAAFDLGLLKNDRWRRFALKAEKALMNAFGSVSSISPRMVERLGVKGVDKQKTYLFPNWAGTSDFETGQGGDWRQKLGLPDGTVLALYSGNLGRKQGLKNVVDAARLLRDEAGIRFVISGDGAARKELEAAAEGLPNVIFLPVQGKEGFISLMLSADIHLLPQKAEAADLVMPSKLGNMLASGKPVLAMAAPGTQIYDEIQGCGVAVPPDDAPAFAEALRALAKENASREGMGQIGRARARERWSIDGVLSRLETLFATKAQNK